MPETPRSCEAICDVEALDPKTIRDEHKQYLQDPNDAPYYDCTNGDFVDSVCKITCPAGFKQWNDSKYPKNTTQCTKKSSDGGWNPASWKLNYCVPNCYPNCS